MRYALIAAFAILTLFVAITTWIVLYPPVPTDLGGVENLDHRAQPVRIAVGEEDFLDGWYVPGRNQGVVLLMHGYGRSHTRMWRYGGFLNRAGYGVLTFDFRSGRGHDRKPTTLGHYEREDAQAALDWLRSQPAAAGKRIGVLGESLGGSVGLWVAARNTDVAAVVGDCAFATGKLALEESCARWARLPSWPTAEAVRWIGRRFTGHDPAALDVLAASAELKHRPVMFIQGLEDNRFSAAQVEQLWRAAGAKDPIWLIPGAGHNQGWKRQRDLYESRVRAFFDRHLLGAGAGLPAGALGTDPIAARARPRWAVFPGIGPAHAGAPQAR
ncbi:MAG: alpha/beta hydrolase [bacterium]